MTNCEQYAHADGERLFAEDRARMLADPELRAIYEEEAAKKELWLQLRPSAGRRLPPRGEGPSGSSPPAASRAQRVKRLPINR